MFHRNPYNLRVYLDAKVEDKLNPKNPLNRKDRPIWFLLLVIIGIILFVYFYPTNVEQGYTCTSLEEALIETDYEEVHQQEINDKFYKNNLVLSHQYLIVNDDFYLEGTKDQLIVMNHYLKFTKNNESIEIYDDYTPSSKKVIYSLSVEEPHDLIVHQTTLDLLGSILTTYTNKEVDVSVYKTLYDQYLKDYRLGESTHLEKTIPLENQTTLKCTIRFHQNPYTHSVQFEIKKR